MAEILCQHGLVCSKTAFTDSNHRHAFSQENLNYLEARRKLLKEDGASRLSAADRARFVARILKHPKRYQSEPSLQKLVESFQREKAREKRKFHRESRELSTTKALDCGRGAGQDRIFKEYENADPDWIDSLTLPQTSSDPYSNGIQSYPELDVKVLLDRFGLEAGSLRAKSLGWPSTATDDCTIYMFVDGRFEGLPRLVFVRQDPDTDETVWQKSLCCPVQHPTRPDTSCAR